MDIEHFVHHDATPGHVFFDRSVLDSLCWLDQLTPLNERDLSMWLSTDQYFPKVFLLPPWKEIYTNDAERDHTFEHAESVNSIDAGVVPSGRLSAHRGTQGFGCRAVYVCAAKRWQMAMHDSPVRTRVANRRCPTMRGAMTVVDMLTAAEAWSVTHESTLVRVCFDTCFRKPPGVMDLLRDTDWLDRSASGGGGSSSRRDDDAAGGAG